MREYRFRKGTARQFNERDWEAEPGDKMVDTDGTLYYLHESSGSDKRKSGELTYRTVKPPKDMPSAKAHLIDGRIFWIEE